MDTIAAIYDALDDEEVFANLPAHLAALAEARSGIVQVFSTDWRLRNAELSYFEPQSVERYMTLELDRHDPWRRVAMLPENLGRVNALDAHVPAEKLRDTFFYRETFAHWGDDTARCLGGIVALTGGFFGFAVHRSGRDAPFSPDDAARMQPLMPHLQRLFELRSRLGAAETKARLSEAALNARDDAVFVVDATGRPALMNEAAQAMLAGSEALVLSRVGLRAPHDASNRNLLRAIATACARHDTQGGALSLQRPSGPPLRALVSPLRAGHLTLALVVINDPAAVDPRQVANLRGFYGLSAAEAETAAALARGLTPAAVAEARGVSMPTIRSQIRSALRKTDAQGIPELVALVSSAPRLSSPGG